MRDFGWQYPPGVTAGMIDRAYGHEDVGSDEVEVDSEPCAECNRPPDLEHEEDCPLVWMGNWQWMA
jgi:hypothetical protein